MDVSLYLLIIALIIVIGFLAFDYTSEKQPKRKRGRPKKEKSRDANKKIDNKKDSE